MTITTTMTTTATMTDTSDNDLQLLFPIFLILVRDGGTDMDGRTEGWTKGRTEGYRREGRRDGVTGTVDWPWHSSENVLDRLRVVLFFHFQKKWLRSGISLWSIRAKFSCSVIIIVEPFYLFYIIFIHLSTYSVKYPTSDVNCPVWISNMNRRNFLERDVSNLLCISACAEVRHMS